MEVPDIQEQEGDAQLPEMNPVAASAAAISRAQDDRVGPAEERCFVQGEGEADGVDRRQRPHAKAFRRMAQMNGEASGLFRENSSGAGSGLRSPTRAGRGADIRCF